MSEENNNGMSIRKTVLLAQHEDERSDAVERLRYQFELSTSAVKIIQILNGGSVLALITFLGNSNSKFDIHLIKCSFSFFIIGLFLSVLSLMCGYLSQNYFYRTSHSRAIEKLFKAYDLEVSPADESVTRCGNRWLFGGFAASVFSLICFVVGSFTALTGIESSSVSVAQISNNEVVETTVEP